VFTEITGTPGKGTPEELLGKARCIVFVPGMKRRHRYRWQVWPRLRHVPEKFGVGWGAPAAMRVKGGSFGFQTLAERQHGLLPESCDQPSALIPDWLRVGRHIAVRGSPVQACKSVTPAGNGVPGGTMGLGAESQKKLPLGS